jgi:hypothetical protein
MIAALFVERDGSYYGLPNVDPWDRDRDARQYPGKHPVVAHPPCERWGRFWHGAPCKPHQYSLGDDAGCFIAALEAVRKFGGVVEHPAYSRAWYAHRLVWPPNDGGWVSGGLGDPGWVCHVEQGHYGHCARKATWLYAVGAALPRLRWGAAPQRLPQVALDRYGYEKARRIGVMAYIGGKAKKEIRSATPAEFRDQLISIAESVHDGSTRREREG